MLAHLDPAVCSSLASICPVSLPVLAPPIITLDDWHSVHPLFPGLIHLDLEPIWPVILRSINSKEHLLKASIWSSSVFIFSWQISFSCHMILCISSFRLQSSRHVMDCSLTRSAPIKFWMVDSLERCVGTCGTQSGGGRLSRATPFSHALLLYFLIVVSLLLSPLVLILEVCGEGGSHALLHVHTLCYYIL